LGAGGVPKILGEAGSPWDGSVAGIVETRSCPRVLPYQISSLYSSNRLGTIMVMSENFEPLHPIFQDHSRSFEPTPIISYL